MVKNTVDSPKSPKNYNPVNPKHYLSRASCENCNHPIECWDVTEHLDFLIGSAMKYLWRYETKGGIEDLEKAIKYITRKIRLLTKTKGS